MARESDQMTFTISYLKLTEDEKHYTRLDPANKHEATVVRIEKWMGDGTNYTVELELDVKAMGPHWDILYVEKIVTLMKAAYVEGRAHARADVRQALGVVGGGGFSGSVYLR